MEEGQNSSSSNGGGSKKWIIISVVAVIIILIVAGGGFMLLKNQEENSPAELKEPANSEGQVQASPTPEAMTTTTPSAASTVSGAPSKSAYKDGTYTAVGKYMTHGGPESIKVTVVLSNGVIKSATVVEQPQDQMTKMMQDDFVASYKPMVIGKNIADLKLGKVSGSSLTPMGFNSALDAIRSQAKS